MFINALLSIKESVGKTTSLVLAVGLDSPQKGKFSIKMKIFKNYLADNNKESQLQEQ